MPTFKSDSLKVGIFYCFTFSCPLTRKLPLIPLAVLKIRLGIDDGVSDPLRGNYSPLEKNHLY